MESFSDLFEKRGRIKGKLIGLKFLPSLLFLQRTEEQMEFIFLPVADRSNETPTSPITQKNHPLPQSKVPLHLLL